MFLFAVPFFDGLAMSLVPLMISARDVAMPRLGPLGFWIYLIAGITPYAGFPLGHGRDAGWFAHAPLSSDPDYTPGLGDHHGRARPPGRHALLQRRHGRGPSALQAHLLVLRPPRGPHHLPTRPGRGGGRAGDLRARTDRRLLLWWRSRSWRWGSSRSACWSTASSPSASPIGLSFLAAASMMVSIPSGIQIFAFIGTVWTGRPIVDTLFLFLIGFVIIFVLGGVTGVMLATVPFDWRVHDRYFVVATATTRCSAGRSPWCCICCSATS